MKKILALILALVMVLSLAACSNAQDNNTNTDTNTNTGNVDTNTGNTDENTGSENDANTENNENVEGGDTTEPDAPSQDETPSEPENNTESNEGGHKLDTTAELSVILQGLYNGYNEELPMLGEMPLEDPETFQYFAFVEYVEGAEAMVSEPMMGSIAHSFVLVRLPEGVDAADFASQMEANADPRKWICVEAEKVAVASYENLALLCMSNEVLVDTAIANFNSMFN